VCRALRVTMRQIELFRYLLRVLPCGRDQVQGTDLKSRKPEDSLSAECRLWINISGFESLESQIFSTVCRRISNALISLHSRFQFLKKSVISKCADSLIPLSPVLQRVPQRLLATPRITEVGQNLFGAGPPASISGGLYTFVFSQTARLIIRNHPHSVSSYHSIQR
jgi:hypothetical protein